MKVIKYLDEGQSGASGIVYKAEDDLGREIAVKFFHDTIGPIRAQVVAHASTLTKIDHPNVIKIYGINDAKRPTADKDAAAEPALFMEYAPGQRFSDWLNKPNLGPSEAMTAISGLLGGLGAFHFAKIAHGDLHEGNVRVFNGTVKIIDPVAREPHHALSTAEFQSQRIRDLSWAKRLIVDALRAANADTQQFGEFCIMRTDITSIPELIAQVELALHNPLQSTNELSAPRVHSFYDFCRAAQRASTPLAWQDARKAAIRSLQPRLNEWRDKKRKLPPSGDLLWEMLVEALMSTNDFLSFLLAAAEAGNHLYINDLAQVRRIATVDWASSGESRFVAIPDFLLMCLHYFAGAAACYNSNFRGAATLGTLVLQERMVRERSAIWQNHQWTGWNHVFDDNSEITWKFLLRAYERIPVLRQVFPDTLSFNSALGAYNWFLATLEFMNQKPEVLKIPAEKMMASDPLYRPLVPPNFFKLDARDLSEAHTILFSSNDALTELERHGTLTSGEALALWKRWLRGHFSYFAADSFGMRQTPSFIFEPPYFRSTTR